jgi:uncharacterized repeat protein (TIGR02543 family)
MVGETGTLTATVAPPNAANKAVTWTSSNNAIATVSGGTVTGVTAGPTTITVRTADGGKTASATVTVATVVVAVAVAFNADGGSPTPSPRTVNSGSTLGTLPAAPTRTGFIFGGWFTAQNGYGTRYTASSPKVTDNITLYAKWTADLDNITEASLDQMDSSMKAVPYDGRGYFENPIVVKIRIADASLLSRNTDYGIDSLGKLYYPLGSHRYVSYDLSGCTFTSIGNTESTYRRGQSSSYLQSITLPDTLTSIGSSAFSDCNSLISVTLGSGITMWGGVFPGDLQAKYQAGGAGTYTQPRFTDTWAKL